MTLARIDGLIVIAITIAICMFGLYSTDKAWIYTNNQDVCGIYCRMAMHYGEMLNGQDFDRKFLQKSSFSLVVYLVAPMLNLKTPLQIIYALEIVGDLCLVWAALYFYWIGKATKCSRGVFYLLFTCLFINQIFIKIDPFAQESPDRIAFLVGMASGYYFLRNKYTALLALFTLAVFVQPQVRLLMIPLLIFCGMQVAKPKEATTTYPHKAYFYLFGAALFIFSVCGYILPEIREPNHGIKNTITEMMPISIFIAAAAISAAFYRLQVIEFFKCGAQILISNKIARKRCLDIFIILAVSLVIVLFFAQGEVLSRGSTLKGIVYYSYSVVYHMLEAPLKSWIIHLAFFGPLPLLLFIKKESCAPEPEMLGLKISLALALVFSFDSESRHLVGFMPWVAILFMNSKLNLKPLTSALFIILTVIASRFYGLYGPATPENDIYLFTWGPWVTIDKYLLTTAIVSISCIFLAVGNMLALPFNGSTGRCADGHDA